MQWLIAFDALHALFKEGIEYRYWYMLGVLEYGMVWCVRAMAFLWHPE